MSCASLARRLETHRVSIASPPGPTSNTYNSNSIAANSSRRGAIWRSRHWPSLIRLARACVPWPLGDHVTAATSIRTRAAMVHRETSSVSGTFLITFVLVAIDDVANPKSCVNVQTTDTREGDDCRCIATIRIPLPVNSW